MKISTIRTRIRRLVEPWLERALDPETITDAIMTKDALEKEHQTLWQEIQGHIRTKKERRGFHRSLKGRAADMTAILQVRNIIFSLLQVAYLKDDMLCLHKFADKDSDMRAQSALLAKANINPNFKRILQETGLLTKAFAEIGSTYGIYGNSGNTKDYGMTFGSTGSWWPLSRKPFEKRCLELRGKDLAYHSVPTADYVVHRYEYSKDGCEPSRSSCTNVTFPPNAEEAMRHAIGLIGIQKNVALLLSEDPPKT